MFGNIYPYINTCKHVVYLLQEEVKLHKHNASVGVCGVRRAEESLLCH